MLLMLLIDGSGSSYSSTFRETGHVCHVCFHSYAHCSSDEGSVARMKGIDPGEKISGSWCSVRYPYEAGVWRISSQVPITCTTRVLNTIAWHWQDGSIILLTYHRPHNFGGLCFRHNTCSDTFETLSLESISPWRSASWQALGLMM